MNNKMILKVLAISENEAFARSSVGAFSVSLNPNISQITDIKTAVSEAVTNAIVHAYDDKNGYVTITAEICEDTIHIIISDEGKGIENLALALEPFFTTKPEEERSGMGFTVMQTFMDKVEVESIIGKGTTITMEKKISPQNKEGENNA